MPAPAHVRDLGPDAGLPAGFRAAGVACGIKPSGNPDLGLLVCDAERPVSAARFTATGTPAAPVLVSQERCRLDALRAVLANSGCANAATGRARPRRRRQDAGRGGDRRRASTRPRSRSPRPGAISHHLPVDAMLKGILDARPRLRADGDADFQQAIQTTDAFEKRASLEVELPSGPVRLSAQCKGAGMISPRFATMLCFVETDAALAPETADLLLGVCVKRSFDRVSVDGQLSTNDTAILMCSGSSGVQRRARERGRAALRRGARRAAAPARDHDGRRRRGRRADRARRRARRRHLQSAEAAARAVANSPLVKTALHGGDPNWGRIAQAVGAALPGTAPLAVDISIEGDPGLLGGRRDPYDERRSRARCRATELEYEIGLPGEGAETEVFFSDLSTST